MIKYKVVTPSCDPLWKESIPLAQKIQYVLDKATKHGAELVSTTQTELGIVMIFKVGESVERNA